MKLSGIPVSLPGVHRSRIAPDVKVRGAATGSTLASPHLDDAIDRYAATMYRVAFRNLGNRVDAEQVTERVFREAARVLDSVDDEAERRSYLLTATCSVIVDVWRSYSSPAMSRPEWTTEAMAQAAGSPERDATFGIARILARLDPVQRRVLVLRLMEGKSVSETGQALGISEANVQLVQRESLRQATEAEKASDGDPAVRMALP